MRLRGLEAYDGKLKKLLAEAHLDMHALKSVLGVAYFAERDRSFLYIVTNCPRVPLVGESALPGQQPL